MIERFFHLGRRGSTARTECLAGLSTFLTSAYIIFVNPTILSAAGMDKGALVTVTCVVTGVATLIMGLWPNAPLMMAPGMGLNAYFAYYVCQSAGVPWPTALGVVFLSGCLFLILALIGVRERIVYSIPKGLRIATAVGIGLFISFIGLQQLGLIVKSDATLVRLGPLNSTTLLGLGGFIFMVALEVRKTPGAILIGILALSVLGMATGDVAIPSALVDRPVSMAPLFLSLDVVGALTWSLLPTIFAFMYVDLFDSIGTLLAVSRRAGLMRADGTIPKIGPLLTLDALATMFGAVCGTSTTVTYIESAVGISQGGRTGLTAVVTALLFFAAMFFVPLVTVVPAYATAPALILVGLHMVRDIRDIQFEDWEEAVPAFLTMLLMPLTFSIANGIMFGFLSHVLLKVAVGKWKDLNGTVIAVTLLSAVNLWIGQH